MNAKFLLVVALVCLAVSTTTAAPRKKRFTCTFFGNWACESHCYTHNRQGGWCDDHNVCHCRTEHIFGTAQSYTNV